MKKFEDEFNYLIELSGKVLTGQIEAEEFEKHRTNFLSKYAENQPQELPEFVAKEFKKLEDSNNKMKTIGRLRFWIGETVYGIDKEVSNWVNKNEKAILRAMLYGYTVKEKCFYLKHIDMSKRDEEYDHYYIKTRTGRLNHSKSYKNVLPDWDKAFQFTQQEIDSMAADSYEQIEVEE